MAFSLCLSSEGKSITHPLRICFCMLEHWHTDETKTFFYKGLKHSCRPSLGPKRINFIIHLLIIILIHYIPYSDVGPPWEQIHLHNPSKDWDLSICVIRHLAQLTSHLRQTDPLLLALPGTDCAWRGGWPRHKATAELTGSGVHLNGLLRAPPPPPRLPSSHYSGRESGQREWMSFIPTRRFHLSDHSRSYRADR